jgi:hypothetical protein
MTEDKLAKIKDRVRKLFALARDKFAFAGEAENALAAANDMMLKYGIENIDAIDHDAVIIGAKYSKPIKRWNTHEQLIANAIAYLFNSTTLFTKDDEARGSWLRFAGTEANVFACENLFDYLLGECARLCVVAFEDHRKAVGRKLTQQEYDNIRPSFQKSFAYRIAHRVTEIKASNRAKSQALMVINQQLAASQEFVMSMPGTQKKELALRYKDGIGTAAGDFAGRAVKLQTEVEA